jgi:hypothetical protein
MDVSAKWASNEPDVEYEWDARGGYSLDWKRVRGRVASLFPDTGIVAAASRGGAVSDYLSQNAAL